MMKVHTGCNGPFFLELFVQARQTILGNKTVVISEIRFFLFLQPKNSRQIKRCGHLGVGMVLFGESVSLSRLWGFRHPTQAR